MSDVIDEHRQYLRDRVRVSAYERALQQVVRPGDVVVDLASGTGILGLLACRAGASRVYAIEHDAIAGLAASIAEANGFGDRIVAVRGHSTMVSLPERADVLVCDQIGRFGLEAQLIDLVRDAKARFLKTGARFVPSRIDLVAVPVQHARLHERVRFWSRPRAGFDVSAALDVAANTGYPARFGRQHLLAEPAVVASIDLTSETAVPIRGRATSTVDRDGTLHGIAGWFTARLGPSVCITNAPVGAFRIQRRQVFFPVRDAVAVSRGDAVDASFLMLPSDLLYSWDVTVSREGRVRSRSRQTTLRGMLLSKQDLQLTDPDGRPTLTEYGRARLTVLELCDGRRPLREIERDLRDRHPNLFQTAGDAAVFVAEVITRYAVRS